MVMMAHVCFSSRRRWQSFVNTDDGCACAGDDGDDVDAMNMVMTITVLGDDDDGGDDGDEDYLRMAMTTIVMVLNTLTTIMMVVMMVTKMI